MEKKCKTCDMEVKGRQVFCTKCAYVRQTERELMGFVKWQHEQNENNK